MALVAYDNSDSSDYEEEDNKNAPVILLNNKPNSKHVPGPSVEESVIPNDDSQPQDKGPNLFNFLPQPKNKKPRVIEEDDEFLHKKEVANAVKPKAKITVPSLSDFKDVENSTPNVKPRSAQKKSDLLSMLPQPRNGVISTKSLIPHVLTKKPAPDKKAPLPTPVKKRKVEATPLVNENSDDSDDEVQNDFFSIHKPVDIPDDIDFASEQDITQAPDKTKEKRKGIEAFFKKEEVVDHVQLEPDFDSSSIEVQEAASSSYNGYSAEPTQSNEMELDDEAIMKLCGARGKRKREEIQIVNVNQQEVLANAREMLLKGLMDDTTQRVSASKKKGNEPTSQQRRKHQITYLAYQAKANEAELQNQWANNRMSKRQTQAKYGF